MAGFNKVLLLGNLTRDPQLSYTPNQTAVVEFGMAVNRRWTGADGQKKDETCFVDCQAYGRMAENINKYLKKGRQLFVEGRLTFNQWTAQDGTKRSKHRVTVESFQFIGGSGGETAPAVEGAAQEPEAPQPAGPAADDDIPF